MTALVNVRCETCCASTLVSIDTMLASVCTDDETLSRYCFTCPVCGPQVHTMSRHEFHALYAAGVEATFWPRSELLADVRKEHAALLREWSDRLPEVLERILEEAS